MGPNKEKETVMRVYGNPQAECQVQKLKRWTESYMPLLLQLSKPSLKTKDSKDHVVTDIDANIITSSPAVLNSIPILRNGKWIKY